MRHRIFIAINLPSDIKDKLIEYQLKWLELPVRWVEKENLHITLIFLGYLSDEELFETLKITKEVISRHKPFFINLKKIIYGPPKKIPPRMIWIEGEKSEELENLQKDLKKCLEQFPNQTTEKQSFTPHITLGRIKEWEFRRIEPEERPEINEEISLSFPVFSIEVMESELRRGGPKYTILESFSLAEE
jgi:2'-5' RNA ligase